MYLLLIIAHLQAQKRACTCLFYFTKLCPFCQSSYVAIALTPSDEEHSTSDDSDIDPSVSATVPRRQTSSSAQRLTRRLNWQRWRAASRSKGKKDLPLVIPRHKGQAIGGGCELETVQKLHISNKPDGGSYCQKEKNKFNLISQRPLFFLYSALLNDCLLHSV